jgi:gluconate 2-dehydrogenase alpha chain
VVSETTRRYGAARIPKGSTVEDWPFGLEELEPYYDKVEYEVGISGEAGNVNGVIDKRGNIFEGPRARGYPMPALAGSEFTERMAAAARKLGWHPFPGPAAVNSQYYDNRPACLYHGFCNRGGCHIHAKNSTAVSTIPKAQATGRLTVVTQAIVTSVAVDDRSGRVRGVIYLKGGEEYVQPADVVLLAGYTYENVRLLLLSKSKPFPNGLANNGGQVGRHYITHHTGATLAALFFIKENADRWNLAYLQKTTLPYEDNVLDLDPTVKDSLGFPVIRITADHKDNEKKLGAFIQDKMAQWFMEAGAIAVERGPMGTMGPSTHAYGGARMGDNRETNVVDRYGFAHEVPNLGILGASVMGTSGAHNPTLTAQALAWRTAEHLTKNWKAIAN